MRLVDEVVELVPGERAAGDASQPVRLFFQGHFPGQPIVPAVMLVEMLAQAGGIAAAASNASDVVPVQLRVAAIGPFKFPAPEAQVSCWKARARVSGRLGVSGEDRGRGHSGRPVVAVRQRHAGGLIRQSRREPGGK